LRIFSCRSYPETTQIKLASENKLVRPLKRPLNRRPAQAAQKPNSPRREQNGDRLHINPQVKSIDTLRAAFKERNYRAIQAHSSGLLLKLALKDSRFALQAHKELLRREDYYTVWTIANHYCDIKTKDIFDGILSDWLETKRDSRFIIIVKNFLFHEVNALFQTLVNQKELKTIAKILNLIKKCGLDLKNTNVRSKIDSCTNLLNPDQIKALANLLDLPSKQDQQAEMSNNRLNNRDLNRYENELGFNSDDVLTKKILLIGGGQSPIKKNLLDQDVHITNVDPIRYDNQENTADKTINEDFLSANIEGKFDEIWCLFSLPLYIVNPEDVTKFYTKALNLLADNGVLRIHPIVLTKENSLSLREMLLKPLVQIKSEEMCETLTRNPAYQVTLNTNDLTIRKKPQTTEVLS
jgi:hypothetical protein